GHDGVTDELLDGAVHPLNLGDEPAETIGDDLAHLFGVQPFAERGEADQVGEEHGDPAALLRVIGAGQRWRSEGDRTSRQPGGSRPARRAARAAAGRVARRRAPIEARAAGAADLAARLVGGAASGTRHSQRCSAGAAEAPCLRVLRRAGRAAHTGPSDHEDADEIGQPAHALNSERGPRTEAEMAIKSKRARHFTYTGNRTLDKSCLSESKIEISDWTRAMQLSDRPI